MKKPILLLLISLAFFLLAGSAWSTPLDVTGMNLTELQTNFTGIGSNINVNTDEAQAEMFAFQSSGATVTYVASISYTASPISFGLYDGSNSSVTLDIFSTSSSLQPGDSTQIYIDYNAASNDLTSYSFEGGFHVIDTATFNSSNIGFWAHSTYGTFYSESELNATGSDIDGDLLGDNDHFLTYMGLGDYVNIDGNPSTPALNDLAHWYIATEVTPLNNNDDDFTDLIVQVESMQPAAVPEPATILFVGIGLAGIGRFGRKKLLKKG